MKEVLPVKQVTLGWKIVTGVDALKNFCLAAQKGSVIQLQKTPKRLQEPATGTMVVEEELFSLVQVQPLVRRQMMRWRFALTEMVNLEYLVSPGRKIVILVNVTPVEMLFVPKSSVQML